jgi:hypothetical protein
MNSIKERMERPRDSFLGVNELLRMTLVEGYRQGREAGSLLFPRPGAARAVERDDGSLPTLSERIATLIAQVRARFDQSAPCVRSDKSAAERADKPQAEPVEKRKSGQAANPSAGALSHTGIERAGDRRRASFPAYGCR